MITVSEVRASLNHGHTGVILDELVRREYAAGRSLREIRDEPADLLSAAQDWPEYDGEPREEWQGILDRLDGSCHRDYRYENVLTAGLEEQVVASLKDFPPADRLRILANIDRRVRAMS